MSAVLQEEMARNWLYAPHAPVRVMETTPWIDLDQEIEWGAHGFVSVRDKEGALIDMLVKVNHRPRFEPLTFKTLNAIKVYFRKRGYAVLCVTVIQEGGYIYYPPPRK